MRVFLDCSLAYFIYRTDYRGKSYVCQEDIVALEMETPPCVLMEKAGWYFKRWDDDKRVFVSNIRFEYPDG